jgi:hypothetical protein
MPRLAGREGNPAICVKDRTLWAHHATAGPLIEKLGEDKVSDIYNGVVEDFWHDIVPDIAAEHGYADQWGQDGRSGGWLVVYRTDFLNLMDADDPFGCTPAEDDDDYIAEAFGQRDKFFKFATAIEGLMEAAGEMLIERLQTAVADLNRAREAAIVRGEN